MTQSRLEEVLLQAAEAASGHALSAAQRDAALADLAQVLFSPKAKTDDPYAALEVLVEGRLARAMGVAFDHLGVAHDERASVRFARDLEAGNVTADTFRSSSDPETVDNSPVNTIVFAGSEAVPTLINPGVGLEGPGDDDGVATIGLEGAVPGKGPLTVVGVGNTLSRVEQAVLAAMPTAKREQTRVSSRGQELIGEVLDGKYRVDTFLGRGGFGSVYKGIELSTNAPVAIKVMHPAVAMRNRASRHFTAEAQRLTKLTHPGVVQWKTYSPKEDGVSYLVMEFVDGVELGEVLEKEGQLSMEEAAPIMLQILDALRAAHSLPGGEVLLHLDLKPGNVLLANRDDDGPTAVKLIDFGIGQYSGDRDLEDASMAKASGAGSSSSGPHDQRGTFGVEAGPGMGATAVRRAVGGTALYASPEQCRHLRRDSDIQDLDTRSDLYSFGVMAYKMLTGEYPYEAFDGIEDSLRSGLSKGEAYLEAFRIHNEQAPRPLRQVKPDLNRRLAALIDQCLAKDPNQRFEDTAQAYAAFAEVLEPKPKALGWMAAGLIGLGFAGVAWALAFSRSDGLATAEVMVEVAPGDTRSVTEVTEGQPLVASPDAGPRFQAPGTDAVWPDDLSLVSIDPESLDPLAPIEGFTFDEVGGARDWVQIKTADTAMASTKVALTWDNGQERSASFWLRLVNRIPWGAAPQALELSLDDQSEATISLLEERVPGVLVVEGTGPVLGLHPGPLGEWIRPGGLQVLLGERSFGMEPAEDGERFVVRLGSTYLLDSQAKGPLDLRFRAQAIDGHEYELPWRGHMQVVSAMADIVGLRVDLVDRQSGEVLQSAHALGSADEAQTTFRIVRSARLVDRSAAELALRFSVDVDHAEAPYKLFLNQGMQTLAHVMGAGTTPNPLDWLLPASADEEPFERLLQIQIDQESQVRAADRAPRDPWDFRLVYDPDSVTIEASLVQGENEWPLNFFDGQVGDEQGVEDLTVLPAEADLNVRCKGTSLIVVERRSGGRSVTSYAIQNEDAVPVPLPVADLAADLEGGQGVELDVRVWSVHELDSSHDLMRLRSELQRHPAHESWTPPEGLERPHAHFRARLQGAGEIQLLATLEETEAALPWGNETQPEAVALDDLQVRIEALAVLGDAYISLVEEISDAGTLVKASDGSYLFTAPKEWDEDQGGPRRQLCMEVRDDLRRGERFILNLAFSSRGPSIQLNEPSRHVPWKVDAMGDLGLLVELEDANEVIQAEAQLRFEGDSEPQIVELEHLGGADWGGKFFADDSRSRQVAHLMVVAKDSAGVSANSPEWKIDVGRITPVYDALVNGEHLERTDETVPLSDMVLLSVPAESQYRFRDLSEASVRRSIHMLQGAEVDWFRNATNVKDYPTMVENDSAGFGDQTLNMERDRSFYLEQHEVSVDQYCAFLRATAAHYGAGPGWHGEPPHGRRTFKAALAFFEKFPGTNPVTGVNWYEAAAYAHWADRRLPTWWEWEFAVRGGSSKARNFALQQPYGERGHYAWIDARSVQPVITPATPLSPEGLAHLCGNASEWTSTRNVKRGAKAGSPTAWLLPTLPQQARDSFAVVGGNINCGTRPIHDYLAVNWVRPGSRGCSLNQDGAPNGTDPLIGFRCAVDASKVRKRIRASHSDTNEVSWKALVE